MTPGLEKAYHIVGIIQKVAMAILTFLMVGVSYKLLTILLNFQSEIKEIHRLLELFYRLVDKSWLF
jgi:TRAP-type C4-dicarboxylate transport system permease small subunit